MTIEEKILKVFEDTSAYDPKVNITNFGSDVIEVSITDMYEYVPLNFKIMMELGEIFKAEYNADLENINVNKWSSSGCETCDYGSRYVQEFTITKPKK